jgi:hypothetical protein
VKAQRAQDFLRSIAALQLQLLVGKRAGHN